MKNVFLLMTCSLLCLLSAGQTQKLTQKAGKEDFVIRSGPYSFLFHKKDLVDGLNEFDLKLKTDNAKIRKQIEDGILKVVDVAPPSPNNNSVTGLMQSVGCYLLLKGKAAIYKGPLQLTEITVEETPPEADLDGAINKVFFFAPVGTTNWILNGHVRAELRK